MEGNRMDTPTQVKQVQGEVFIIDQDGSVSQMPPEGQIAAGQVMLTGRNGQAVIGADGQAVQVGPDCATCSDEQGSWVSSPHTLALNGKPDKEPTNLDLEALQQAIRAGADPTAVFAETAAGPAATAGGGVVGAGSSAAGFIVVDRTNDATLAEAGFDTSHQAALDQPRGPLGGDYVDTYAAITVFEPQTRDNIINADEVTQLIIRGQVEDVEVGQPVTVTLTDSAGNSLTVITVVLPGNQWAADFGDVTGKLVDGPLTIHAHTVDLFGNEAVDDGLTLLDTITTITLDLADESDSGASQTDDLTHDTRPLLQGKGEPGATVTLTLGNQVLAVLTVDGAGNWQFPVPQTLADGSYDFKVDSVDIAGNKASDTLTVTVDTQAGIDIDDLDAGQLWGSNNATLSGTVTQVEPGQIVSISLNGAGQPVLNVQATVGADGRWQVDGLDLSGFKGPIAIKATVTDLAGNQVSDGVPLVGQSDTLVLFEADLANGPISQIGQLNTGAGVDGGLKVTLAADQSALESLHLTSHGALLTYQQGSQGLVASANGQPVFTLTVNNNGTYTLTWQQSLDHGQDKLVLPFALEYRDSDGDLVEAPLRIELLDSTPPDFQIPGITLTEDAFQDASAVVGIAQFDVKHGADPILANTLTFVEQAGVLAGLQGQYSSDGHPLTFEFVDDLTLSGYYLDGNGQRVEVLQAKLSASQNGDDAKGEVSVSLTGPLDHQSSDALTLGLKVGAVEIDGDATSPAELQITIQDGRDPALGIDSGISLQEGGSGHSLDGQLPVNVGSDRLVSLNFEASQPALDGLTSGGKPTSYQVNGNQITLLDAGGKTVLTVTLDLDGKYHVTLDGVLDQPVGTNSVNLGLQVQGTDFDGDKSNLGTLNIQITDGALPQVDPVSLTLVEDSDWSAAQTLSGDLNITAGSDPLASISFDASQPGLQGLTSGGQPVVISISGNSISGAVNGQNVFTLTLTFDKAGQQGHYVFTLNQPLDQGSADSLLKAGFTLTDSDGDTVSSTLSVAIGDGANPVISAVTGTSLTEANQGDAAVVGNMSFTVSHGSDALDQSSLRFDVAAIQQSLDGKYSSHGSPVTFTLDANGDLVGTSADGREVLRAELSLIDNNGNWSVTAKVVLSGELDHQGSESLDLPLAITLTDKDGDRVSTQLPLTIKDGNAPGFVAGSGVSLDEGNLDGSSPLTGTGHFTVDAGSDRVSEVSFADIAEQPALTALGQSVKYELVDGDASIPGNQILKGYVDVNGVRVEVLQVEISGKLDNAASNDFDYKVTLFEGVHQTNGSSTELPFKVNVVDSDKGAGNNDTTSGTLNISVAEGDKPTLSLTGVTLNEGRFDGAGSNQTADDQQATGTLTITADSDPVVDVRLTLSGQVLDARGKAITHNGETLTWQEVAGSNGHSFQGMTASGTLVLSITLPSVPGSIAAHSSATLDYQITVHTNLDHGADDRLNLTLPVQVTDSDGSVISGSTTAVITDAVDPSLGIDTGVTLQEGGASHSLDGQLPVNVGSDRLVSLNFEASQPALDGLTSGGKPTSYQVNGNQITLLDAGGKTILTVTLGLDGKYQVALDGVLDQPVSTNSVNLGLQVLGSDFDGDQSNLGTLNIQITDGVLPQVDPVSLTLVEDSDWSAAQTLSGDLNITAGSDPLASISFDASQPGLQGLTSGGQPVVISISGNSISGAVNGQNVFTLTLVSDQTGQQGHYVFTLNQPLDQGSADSRLLAGFTLTDSDGDTVSSSLSVAIGDGANPVISAVTGTSLTEVNQGDGAVVGNMSFTVNHGSDALDQSSLRFDIAAIQQSLNGKYSSHGSPVTFSLDADGELVGTSSDGREVLRAELSLIDHNGDWSVTAKVVLSAELDHQGSESLDLPLAITLTDKDGDRVSTQLPLTIKDGNAPGFVAGSGVSLDEGNLDGSSPLTGTGHFTVDAGSDRVSEVSFADIAEQPALTALGQSVKYELVDGDASIPGNQILKGYVEVNGVRVEVLQVEISGKLDNAASNGFDYKVTLFEGVHQTNGGSTELPFKVNVVDSDKGSGNNDSTSGTLNISVAEGDKPTLSLTGVTLNEGRFDGAANNQTADDQQASGTLTIEADSDPVVDVRLTLSGQVLDASGKAITHNGETLTWQEVPGSNGHSFQGVTASGTLVLSVTLPSVPGSIAAHSSATLDYKVTVHTNLDHGADDKLNLTLPVRVTDSDGSVITGNTTAVITDAADPVISSIGSVTVKESDLDGGTGQHGGTSPSGTGEVAVGQVTIAAGSDRVAALQLDVARFNALNTLTSGGKVVSVSADSQPGVYLGKDSGGKLIFKLTLEASGRYIFELTGNLDHSAQGKDLLDIQLPLQALDHDGDLSGEVIGHVSVQDDVPVAVDAGKSLDQGAKVSGDLLAIASEGADDAVVRSVTINGVEHPIAASGNTTIAVTDSTGQTIGTLVINAEGNYSFTARADIDHSNTTLLQKVDFHLVDGDGDTDDGVLTLTIRDEAGSLIVKAVPGQEDAGATDPTQGIPITMTLDVGDFDRGEHVETLLIQAPANAHGTFYFNGVALTTLTQGGKTWYQVPPAAMVSSDNEHYQTQGLTFVPAHDYSSYTDAGKPLSFPVQLQVGVTDGGSKPPLLTGNLAITVEGIADKPVWIAGNTDQHYSLNEDASGIALNVQASLTDTDGSETLSYQLKWESGLGSLTLNGKLLQPDGSGLYTVAAGDINKVTVVPGKDYSGDIKLVVTPVSTEKTPVASGHETALGDPIDLIINVNPLADDAKLTVRDIQGKEDTLLDLGGKISLAGLADNSDGSEQLFVRIEGLPAGATLLLGGVVVAQDAKGYYEVPYDQIANLKLQPAPESNVDFNLVITGVVKDTASLTDANGNVSSLVSETVTASQTLHVDLVGVVDTPLLDLNTSQWQPASDQGFQITIKEDGTAPLDFKLISGEIPNAPTDTSETLNLVLYGLPDGALVLDGQGNPLSLTYAGLDASGQPIYQVDIGSLGNIQIKPPLNSTQDINLIGRVVVTENDGESKTFETPLHIRVEPLVDAGDYSRTSHGLEDEFTALDWQPHLSDGAEKVTALTLTGIEPGYEIWVKDSSGTHQLIPSAGSVSLSDTDLQSLLNGGQLLVKAPEDSDRDTVIHSKVTITQQDVDSSAIDVKVIDGTLNVDIQAVVEPDGKLQIDDPFLLGFDDQDIDLSQAFSFQDLDPSSVEAIDYVVISGLPDGFSVVGGINDGKGNWTVPAANMGAYALKAPDNFTGLVEFNVSARIVDHSDDGDPSVPVEQTLSVTAIFLDTVATTDKAALITFNPVPVTGVEDHRVDLGSQLKSQITIASQDSANDEVSIVISGLPAGVSLQGLNYDFVNGQYLIKLPTSLNGLENLTLGLPTDFAGKLTLDVRVVNTDVTSGDNQLVEQTVSLEILPEVDVNGGADGQPTLALSIKDINGDGQPDNLEDTRIHLNMDVKLADISPSVAGGGLERVQSATVTVDPRFGHFLDGAGNPVNTLTVTDPAALKDLVFVPKENFSGTVPVAVTLHILDEASTGTATADWQANLAFEVKPVNDPATLTVQTMTGDEDGKVGLGGLSAQLVDTDGSEKIVALQIKGVPDGFILSAPASNNGNGVWQVPVGTNMANLKLIPPADFSGSLDLTFSAFTLDKGLTIPLETSAGFTVTINPVGDVIIADIQGQASGTEGDVITLSLGLETRDTQATGGSAANVHEQGPEQLRVTIDGVPDGAEIRLPSGVTGTVVDLGGGRWQVTTDGGKLDAVELVTHDANGMLDLKVTAQSLDNGALGPEVNGNVQVDVSAVNDAPVNLLPVDPQVAQEDKPFTIQGLQVKDVDAGSGNIEVRLSVAHGSLTVLNAAGVTVTGDGTGSLLLSGSLVQINALLSGGIDYLGNSNFNGSDALTMVTNDLGNTGSGGALSDTDVLPIEIQPVNDDPVNILPPAQVAQEESIHLIQGLQVQDVDAEGKDIRVTLSVGNGSLTVVDSAGVSVTGDGSGSVTLLGSQDAINTLLGRGIHYLGDANFNGSDQLTMVTNDLGNTGSGGGQDVSSTLDIAVQPVNDAPELTLPGSGLSLGEDGDIILSGISVKDVDAGTAPMQVTLKVEHGLLVAAAGAGVTVLGSNSNSLILTGAQDALNAFLAGAVHYQPSPDYWGDDNLSLVISDLGSTGSGGALEDSGQLGINVAAQADMPNLQLDSHGVTALVGGWVPLSLSAWVANPEPGELSIRLSGLDGAQVLDQDGRQVGQDLGNGDWLLPGDSNLPLFLDGFGVGSHNVSVQAESSSGGSVISSTPDTLEVHTVAGNELHGSGGDDHLVGSQGDDILYGGAGSDILTGGLGSDTFAWTLPDAGSASQPAVDTITDFNLQQGDRLDLSDMLGGVSGSDINSLLSHIQVSVTAGANGVSDLHLDISPAGDGQITQSIDVKSVDLSSLNMGGGSQSEILTSLIDNQHLIVDHP
jgi:large repetitive protein